MHSKILLSSEICVSKMLKSKVDILTKTVGTTLSV